MISFGLLQWINNGEEWDDMVIYLLVMTAMTATVCELEAMALEIPYVKLPKVERGEKIGNPSGFYHGVDSGSSWDLKSGSICLVSSQFNCL